MRLRTLDYVAVLGAVAAIALASLSAYSKGGGEARVIIDGPAGEWIYPLGEDRSVRVEGPLGSTRVEIHGKAVHIADSPCPNKTCVASGGISSSGQWLACLPNQVFVRVEGGSGGEGGIDAGTF